MRASFLTRACARFFCFNIEINLEWLMFIRSAVAHLKPRTRRQARAQAAISCITSSSSSHSEHSKAHCEKPKGPRPLVHLDLALKSQIVTCDQSCSCRAAAAQAPSRQQERALDASSIEATPPKPAEAGLSLTPECGVRVNGKNREEEEVELSHHDSGSQTLVTGHRPESQPRVK